MSTLRVCLHHSGGWIARAIRWQTRSYWNHASVLVGNTLVEALPGPGVSARRTLADAQRTEDVRVFTIPHLTDEGAAKVVAFLDAQLGKPYDKTMIIRFVTRQQANRRQRGQWFCSELVFAALQAGGVNLLSRIEPWAVSPGTLALSPRLVAV